jgi:hypothetical protein
MTARWLSEKQLDKHTCVFETFERGERRKCDKPAVAKIGRDGYVCCEHLDYHLSVSPTPVEKPL